MKVGAEDCHLLSFYLKKEQIKELMKQIKGLFMLTSEKYLPIYLHFVPPAGLFTHKGKYLYKKEMHHPSFRQLASAVLYFLSSLKHLDFGLSRGL